MICLVCKHPMQIRNGKYGDFYYCQYGQHGTISVERYEAILKMVPPDSAAAVREDPLMVQIEQTQAAIGGGIMSDLERFYIDTPAYDPNDFWQDLHPHG